MWSPGKAVREWRERLAREAEIAAFPAEGLRDLGLNRREFGAMARMDEGRVARMEGMAEAFGVDRRHLAADRELRFDVTRTCANCGDDGDCRKEFAMPDGPRADRAGFCPNAPTYRAMAKDAGR